jgi:hypothetical protein
MSHAGFRLPFERHCRTKGTCEAELVLSTKYPLNIKTTIKIYSKLQMNIGSTISYQQLQKAFLSA